MIDLAAQLRHGGDRHARRPLPPQPTPVAGGDAA